MCYSEVYFARYRIDKLNTSDNHSTNTDVQFSNIIYDMFGDRHEIWY